jgi:TPP-dependent pyruvate/acetoin dehydrogenase alpha subunit
MVSYSKAFMTDLMRGMLRIRLCEESLVQPILKNEIRCPVHLCSGQEAVAVGVCTALERSDYVFGNHRSHGHYLAKGGQMNALVAEIFGKESGCSRGRGGSMHLIDPDVAMLGSAPIVAGTIPLALGAALASEIREDGRVTVNFFGDGATNEGVLFESMNFASLKKLPIIFVCENNLYATHMPIRECRPDIDIVEMAKSLGINAYQVNGNDVLDVYRVSKESVEICRKGEGPIFMECFTYRLRGHVGPDDNIQGAHTDIRPKKELEAWLKKDPIRLFEKYLLDNKVVDKPDINDMRIQIQKEVEEAHRFAYESDYPEAGDLEKYVYSQ